MARVTLSLDRDPNYHRSMSRARRSVCLVFIGLALASGCGRGFTPRLNVVLLVLDTVRADRLACSGPG